MLSKRFTQVEHIRAHDGPIWHAKHSPDGTKFATASSDSFICIFSTTTWQEIIHMQHPKRVNAVSWHPSNDQLLSACYEGIYLWDVHSGDIILKVSAKEVYPVEWLPNGEYFACGDDFGTVFVYTKAGSLVCSHRFTESSCYIRGLSVVSDSQILVDLSKKKGGKAYQLCLMSFKKDKLALVWKADGQGIYSKTSPVYGGKFVLVGSYDNEYIDLWNLELKRIVSKYKGFREDSCTAAVLGPKGEYVVGGHGSEVVLWNRVSQEVIARMGGHSELVNGIALHRRSPWEFVSYNQDGSFIVWKMHNEAVTARTVSPPVKDTASISSNDTHDSATDKESRHSDSLLKAQVETLSNEVKDLRSMVSTLEQHSMAIVSLQSLMDHLGGAVKELQGHARQHTQTAGKVVTLDAAIKQLHTSMAETKTHKPKDDHKHQGTLLYMEEATNELAPLPGVSMLTGHVKDMLIVSIQLHGTNYYLAHTHGSPFTFPLDHFGFQLFPSARDISTHKECQFLMEKLDDGRVMFRNVADGGLLCLRRDLVLYADGFLATTQDKEDESTRFQVNLINSRTSLDDFSLAILVGIKRHHLYCATIKDVHDRPYKLLATRSILPEPFGVFVIRRVAVQF